MPSYNTEKYIEDAIESILNQTYKNIELIVIDDGSTDDSWEIIQRYTSKDKRVINLRNKKNIGIVRTRNNGLVMVSDESKYVAMLDSDDIAMKDRIKKQVQFMEKNSEYGIVGSNIKIIDENNINTGERKYNNYDIYIKNPLAQSSVLIRKNIFENAGLYDRKYVVCEDWDLWFRINSISKIGIMNEYLIQYRINSSQSKSNKLKLTILNSIKIKMKYMKKNNQYKLKYFIRLILESVLYILPSKLVLWLFKKMEYRTKEK